MKRPFIADREAPAMSGCVLLGISFATRLRRESACVLIEADDR